MKLVTLAVTGEPAALSLSDVCVPLSAVNTATGADWPTTVDDLLATGRMADLAAWYADGGVDVVSGLPNAAIPRASGRFSTPFRPKGKIWGIGLNYREHAGDLDEIVPEGLPGSFIKPVTTVIGPGDTIRIPRMSERTTAEAELGVVIGKTCRNVAVGNWRDVVAGFTTIIDMTAEDILRRNPRYLTLCKSFDTFFVFGPELLTPDEVPDVSGLRVTTVHNGSDHATNLVSNMTFPPADLVALHSEVMTLHPGDIISTGTPGAAPIAHGDTVTCRIPGFADLSCPVIDEKVA